ncbi:hypothetical protein [Salibacterium aidingense]|uniref:hypothetical protein n=1 Tax=Salibacterium aidingense TaxID=384933 RepID=UPI00047CA9D0|nr:hypothetical protein [Salibacterium aidingense]
MRSSLPSELESAVTGCSDPIVIVLFGFSAGTYPSVPVSFLEYKKFTFALAASRDPCEIGIIESFMTKLC